jgi:hypothetical protein
MRAILCSVLSCLSLGAQGLILEQASTEFFQGAVVIPEQRFRQPELVGLARQHMARHAQQQIVKLFMATTREAAAEALTVSGAGERQYLTFALRYLKPGWASWGTAEAIRIGQNSVLRIHYPDGSIRRVVLAGTDPLVLGPVSEVLHVYLPPRPDGPPQTPPVLFVRTAEPLSESTCGRIIAELRSRTGLPEADVRLRNDRWFITSPKMPVRYAFWEYQQIPGPVEFIEGRTALCGWDTSGRTKTPQIIYPTRKPKYCDTP